MGVEEAWMMNTMHQLLGNWEYVVLALLGVTAAAVLGAQVFIESLSDAIARKGKGLTAHPVH
jgi:hypothetical protein